MEKVAKDMFKEFEQRDETVAECSGCRIFIGSNEVIYNAHYPCKLAIHVVIKIRIVLNDE